MFSMKLTSCIFYYYENCFSEKNFWDYSKDCIGKKQVSLDSFTLLWADDWGRRPGNFWFWEDFCRGNILFRSQDFSELFWI